MLQYDVKWILLIAAILCAVHASGCANIGSTKFSDSDAASYAPSELFASRSAVSGLTTAADPVEFEGGAEPDRKISAGPLSLRESIEIAIGHSTFFRDRHQFLSDGNSILHHPLQTPSAFDQAISRSSDQSVESAMAAYSPTLTIGGLWGQNSIVQANSSIASSDVLLSDNASAYGRLYKPLRSGGVVSLVQNLNYTSGNVANQFLNPDFAGFVRGELRQPLGAGRGREFTDIAGPLTYRNRAIGFGVSVAELKEELPALDFEENVANLARQTEELYWELWLAERTLQYQESAMQSAKELWQRIQNRATTGLPGGSVVDLTRAEENYYEHLKMLETAFQRRNNAELQLKRLLGFSSVDDRQIIAQEEPAQARIVFDLPGSLAIAKERRVELRRHKLQVRVLEMQLVAANSLKKPQLDLLAGVQLNGLGNGIVNSPSSFSPSSLGADDVGWNVGLELFLPVGLRKERQFARSLELQLSKLRAAWEEQTNEIGHEIHHAITEVERWYAILAISQQRLESAVRGSKAIEAEYDAGRISLDQLLNAQLSLLAAKVDVDRSLTEYNKAIAGVLYRRGSIFESCLLFADQLSANEAG